MKDTNRACVLTAPKTLEFTELPMPTPGPGEILMKLGAVGVCGSDVHVYSQQGMGCKTDFPFILGHECSGTVVEVGSEVKDLKVGDRVALEPGIPCGKCRMCRSGHYNLCPDVRFFATPPVDGCLMNYVIFPAEYAFKLPDSMSFTQGALVEPLAIGINAALTGGVKLGDTVLIFGAGCIGLVTLLAAKAYGASKVIVTDLIPLRLEAARRMGAIVVNSKEENLLERVNELTGGWGADVVIDCAGFSDTVKNAVLAARPAARVVVVGMGAAELNGIPLAPLSLKELVVTSIFRYKNLYPTTINAIESGFINIDGIVSKVFSFDQTPEAFQSAYEYPTETVKNVILFDK